MLSKCKTMEVTILGSGTYQPELTRHCSSYLVKISKQNLIFDFGRGAIDQLLKVGIEYYDIDVIFITHVHADHCSELGSFLHIALAEPPNGKLRKKDVIIYGPKGIKETVNHLLEAFGHLEISKPKYKVEIRELKDRNKVKGNNWTVESFAVKHSPNIECLAYRLESNGKVLAYSGDTEYCQGLKQCCRDADLAIVETDWPKEEKGHMHGKKTGKLAYESKVKKLVLTHVAPYYLKDFDAESDVRSSYDGPLFLAKDLMKIEL